MSKHCDMVLLDGNQCSTSLDANGYVQIKLGAS